MTLAEFSQLQRELWWAFGWVARWWLILFAVSAFGAAVMVFFSEVVSGWLNN